jgi:hypothetical protein
MNPAANWCCWNAKSRSVAAWGWASATATTTCAAKFDAAIKSMKCDGTLDAMITKAEYFGPEAKTWGDAGKEGC